MRTMNVPRRHFVAATFLTYNERFKEKSESPEMKTTKPPLNQANREITSEAAPSKKPLDKIAVDGTRDDASRSEMPSGRRRTGSDRREPRAQTA